LTIRATTAKPESFCLARESDACKPTTGAMHTLIVTEPPVQIGIPTNPPEPGARTTQLKVLDEEFSAKQAVIRFEAQPQSTYDLPVRLNRPHIMVTGGELMGGKLHLQFPGGDGYQGKTVQFSW
jgi:hypothetical protein